MTNNEVMQEVKRLLEIYEDACMHQGYFNSFLGELEPDEEQEQDETIAIIEKTFNEILFIIENNLANIN